MTRITTSVSLSPEHQAFIKKEKLSPTQLLQQAIDARMNGHYDADRETMVDQMFERFLLMGSGRSFTHARDWLKSPAWEPDLEAAGLTAMGFFSICRKRVESNNGSDEWARYLVGLTDKQPENKRIQLTPGMRAYIDKQRALKDKWTIENEEELSDTNIE